MRRHEAAGRLRRPLVVELKGAVNLSRRPVVVASLRELVGSACLSRDLAATLGAHLLCSRMTANHSTRRFGRPILIWPVAMSTTILANWFMSRGRFGMAFMRRCRVPYFNTGGERAPFRQARCSSLCVTSQEYPSRVTLGLSFRRAIAACRFRRGFAPRLRFSAPRHSAMPCAGKSSTSRNPCYDQIESSYAAMIRITATCFALA